MNIIPAAHKLRAVSITAQPSDLLDKQRRWIEALLAATRMQPTELARRADLSPSTLTRFLNDPDHVHALATRTVEALEKVTGVRAYEMPASIPAGFAEADAHEFIAGAGEVSIAAGVAAMIGPNNALIPWRLSTRALETAGYMPGDILIVDLNARAKSGDIVCAQVYDWQHSRANTVLRVFNPPVLVAASLDPTSFKPLVVDDDSIAIKGVVVAMFRARAAA
jgi:SOS-response transcriptional repressor LexA